MLVRKRLTPLVTTTEPVEEAQPTGESSVQESDLKEEDIEIVMSHVNCTRPEAIKQLIQAGGDSVQVILSMTQ